MVEDDRYVIDALRRNLRTTYIIDLAQTAAESLHFAEVNEYDVVVLDLGLPDGNGLTVCHQLRALPSSPPILVLTAHAATAMKVALLDSGADDYMTKPFRIEELQARLRVLVRRESRAARSSIITVGDLTLNSATREVERRGTPIHLRRKEFGVLEYLMHHHGSVVTRAMIIEHVWDGNDNLWTNAVDVHIKYLRDRIDRPFGSAMIHTVHGVGYKLAATLPELTVAE